MGIKVPIGFKIENDGVILTDLDEEIKRLIVRVVNYSTNDYFETVLDVSGNNEVREIFRKDSVKFPYLIIYYAVLENYEISKENIYA